MNLWDYLCKGMQGTPEPPPYKPAPPEPGTGYGRLPQLQISQPEILPEVRIPTPITYAYYAMVPSPIPSPVWNLKLVTIQDPKFNLMDQHNMPTNQFLNRPSRDVLIQSPNFDFYQGPYIPSPDEPIF